MGVVHMLLLAKLAGSMSVFRSMSVSILFFDFFKVDVGFGIGFSNYRDIGVVFLTNN